MPFNAMLYARALSEILCREIPVHQIIKECFDIFGAQVAIIDIVGMFPHVHAQQRLVAGGQRRSCCAHVDDIQVAVGFLHQPGPAGTEVTHGGSLESLLEVV